MRPGYPKHSESHQLLTDWYATSSGLTSFGHSDQLTSFSHDVASGDNTPGFPSVLRTNSYSRRVSKWTNEPMSVVGSNVIGPGVIDHFGGQWPTSSLDGGSIPTLEGGFWDTSGQYERVRDACIARLISDIQNNRVQTGEIYHTRDQTADLVASTARRLTGAVRALHNGNVLGCVRQLIGTRTPRKSVHGLAGGVPEVWLQLQYGWKPLLSDVYNSLEAVRKAWSSGGDAIRAHGSFRDFGPYRSRDSGGPDHFPVRRFESPGPAMHGNAVVYYRVSSFSHTLSQFGITNPLSLAWELLPYSFVVDWFLPIGPYLESLDYARGLEFDRGWYSAKKTMEASARLIKTSRTVGGISANWSGGSGSGSEMSFTREAFTSFPDVPPPRFKSPFSLTHVANAVSLLATAFGVHR